jgi:hypothetical protein
VIGGVLEVALGVGGVAVLTPVTAVGGIILIPHGSDTLIAGFRTLWSGEITPSLTQTGAAATAEGLGASPKTAQRIGIGADLVAGVGPSITIGASRRLATAGAEQASHRAAVAYLHKGALIAGHDEVAKDALDNSCLLGNDGQLEPVGAQSAFLSCFVSPSGTLAYP